MTQRERSEGGSQFGAILLVAGSAIGAGMLGIPLATGLFGFWPSVVVFIFCWLFMSCTALFLLEVNLFAGKDSNIITMAENSLGKLGKGISFAVYVFLIYSLNVAYIDASGGILKDFLFKNFNLEVSAALGSTLFAALFGLFIFLGTFFVDRLNRFFMLSLIISYFLLIAYGVSTLKISLLSHKVWGYSLLSIPVVITSFGYHNIIPTLTSYLKGNRKKMIGTVLIGGAIPLLIYVIWEGLILGVVPYTVFRFSPTLDHVISFIPFSKMSTWLQYFAFFAIATSFLAQGLGLIDFLRDASHLSKKLGIRFLLTLLVIIPPLLLALGFPGIFIKALGYVGGFAAIVLFVLIPAFMVWELRYKQKNSNYKIVPGGRFTLTLIIALGVGIIALELLQELFQFSFIKLQI